MIETMPLKICLEAVQGAFLGGENWASVYDARTVSRSCLSSVEGLLSTGYITLEPSVKVDSVVDDISRLDMK